MDLFYKYVFGLVTTSFLPAEVGTFLTVEMADAITVGRPGLLSSIAIGSRLPNVYVSENGVTTKIHDVPGKVLLVGIPCSLSIVLLDEGKRKRFVCPGLMRIDYPAWYSCSVLCNLYGTDSRICRKLREGTERDPPSIA
jgi:hypothetical protein